VCARARFSFQEQFDHKHDKQSNDYGRLNIVTPIAFAHEPVHDLEDYMFNLLK
jgi:hypothetical protein